jgi:formamidopyrimidine-DNA glycosylase
MVRRGARREIHRRPGEACPRCGATIEGVHCEDYVMCYRPTDQTVLKDRRLSRLPK